MRKAVDSERRILGGRRSAPTAAAFAVALCLATLAGAEEASAPEGVVDVPWHLASLGSALDGLAGSPADGGQDGAMWAAWKEVLRRRIGNMRQRLKRLGSPRNWVVDGESETVRGLLPGKWTAFVRDLATLHTELGTAAEGYRRTWVTIGPGMRRWRRRHPGPEPIGIVPSRWALDEVERAISDLLYEGLDVPQSLIEARDRLRLAVWEEEERERAKKQAEYDALERRARAAVEEQVAATQRRLDRVAEDLVEGQRSLRVLLTTLQRIEEDRIRKLLGELPADEEREGAAAKLFEKMSRSRAESLAFDDPQLSRYGAELSQGWMVPRTKLLALVAHGK